MCTVKIAIKIMMTMMISIICIICIKFIEQHKTTRSK